MDKSNKKFIKRWRKTRRKGFFRYLMVKGPKAGIIATLIGLSIIYFETENKIMINDMLYIGLSIFFSAGILYAVVSWFINNFVYSGLKD